MPSKSNKIVQYFFGRVDWWGQAMNIALGRVLLIQNGMEDSAPLPTPIISLQSLTHKNQSTYIIMMMDCNYSRTTSLNKTFFSFLWWMCYLSSLCPSSVLSPASLAPLPPSFTVSPSECLPYVHNQHVSEAYDQ